MFRTAVSSTARTPPVAARLIHSTPAAHKTVMEQVSDVADTVNKQVGKHLASAIETGEKATETVKDKLGSVSEKTKKTLDETAHAVGQKADKAKEDLAKQMKK